MSDSTTSGRRHKGKICRGMREVRVRIFCYRLKGSGWACSSRMSSTPPGAGLTGQKKLCPSGGIRRACLERSAPLRTPLNARCRRFQSDHPGLACRCPPGNCAAPSLFLRRGSTLDSGERAWMVPGDQAVAVARSSAPSPARCSQVDSTESGLRLTESMPCSISHPASAGWSLGP